LEVFHRTCPVPCSSRCACTNDSRSPIEFAYATITLSGAAFQPASTFDRIFDFCLENQLEDGRRTTPGTQRLIAYTYPRAGSKLAVRNAKNPELPDGSAMGPTQSQPKPSYHQSHSTGPRGRQASGIQPLEPLLLPKLRSFFADFPWSHCSRGPEAIHLGVLMRISVRSVRQGRWSQGDLP
jgi:hypothetical protein